MSGLVTFINSLGGNEIFPTFFSLFNALLGGGRDPNGDYRRIEAHGFYWTSTEASDSTAWFGNFGKGRPALYLQNDGEKARAFAVRCVKGNVWDGNFNHTDTLKDKK